MEKTMSIDEQIEHLLTDHKILLFRYDASLRREIVKRLNKLQKQMLSRISAVGLENASKRDVAKLLGEIKELIKSYYVEMYSFTDGELQSLLPIEALAMMEIYNQSVKFDLFNKVPDYKLKANKTAQIVAGSPLSDWFDKQGGDLSFKFSGLIRQGILDGKATSRIITEVNELMVHSRRSAETLVRTAVMKVNDEAHKLLRDENMDIIKGEQHISTLDTRTSEVCRARDGLVWDLNQKPIGDHKVPYQRPPLHPNCRSTLRLIMKSWRELGFDVDEIPESTRASMDGQVKANITYEDWLKNKTKAQQDEILGKGKADLWRNGVITFRDMLDQSGRPLTLKELREQFKLGGVEGAVNAVYKRASELEPAFTNDMLSIVKQSNGYLDGLDYRLKSIDSITRKVQMDIIKTGITEGESLSKITDIVRYTTIFESKNFTQNYFRMQKILTEKGYNITRVKNTWRKGAVYKGINTIIEKDGIKFEMQYHTKQSFDLKNGKLHELYEKARVINGSSEELKRLNEEMKNLSDQLETPVAIGKIRN
ncbi:minor capsid protein [Pasteurella multocida]|uniref:minor capsid protein n=2 Tax=Pasteurella multocida TaxID=747 RepID=UPI001CB94E0B|nr:minor capsid protein [Pasteurella multocida]MCL8064619.1 minor capsid protein [Pasteurella multocida]MDY0709968.1 minor capsid protein [Pasteurella multocida]URK00337.1 minor capsid protein [Pasteurella multocida]URK07813.1 minor capsid protein [Pasteurella multocida]UZJ34609.1 minor capsid protein [Pasteurella multocida]